MVKLKTHKGAAKRFKKTASGKFKHKKAYTRHILTKKNSKRKRNLRGLTLIDGNSIATVKQMLPNI